MALDFASGRPALFVFGEAGIGKSTALRAASKAHTEPVFRVTCQRVARDILFDPLVALLQTVSRHADPGTPARRASEKEVVLELQFALERSTRDAAPLVQIDDLHWADDATLEAVPYLVERLQDLAIHWQFASRTGYEGVDAVFHRLRRAELAGETTLSPLSEEAIATIIDQQSNHVDEAERAAIVAQAGGNPLYAELLARASSPVASNISLAAHDHVVDLPANALVVAVALAVVDEPMVIDVLPEVTALSPAFISEALEMLRGRRLVEVHDGRIAVRHYLLADAILHMSPPDVTARVHLGAARIAEDDEKRARHLLAGGRRSESRETFVSLGWNALAAEDWDAAARCLAEAIALEAPADAPPLGRSESIIAALRFARRIGARDAPAAEMDGPHAWSGLAEAVRARLELARIAGYLFHSPKLNAVERARIVELAAGDIEPAIAAELYYQSVHAARLHLDDDSAKKLLEKLRALIPSLTSTASRVKALARSAMYTAVYDDWVRGIGELEDALRAGTAAHAYDAVLEVVARAIGAMVGLGRLEEALTFGQFAYALPGGSLRWRTRLAGAYSVTLNSAGRPKEAISVLAGATAAASSLPRRERPHFLAFQIWLASQLGMVERAHSLIAECTDVDNTLMQLAIGYFNEQHGDPEVARDALEADFENPVRLIPLNLRYSSLALARLALKSNDASLMRRALRRLRTLGGHGTANEACVAWGEAYALLMEGNCDAALVLLQQAKNAPLAVLEIARVQLEIAGITGRPEDFLEAIERFRSVDCEYMIDRTYEIAKRMGVRIGKTRPKRTSASTLTDRQRTIALMISSGRTNAEIAAALSISKRTAEHHVDHIRDKLGVRSRVEIAVAVANGAAFD